MKGRKPNSGHFEHFLLSFYSRATTQTTAELPLELARQIAEFCHVSDLSSLVLPNDYCYRNMISTLYRIVCLPSFKQVLRFSRTMVTRRPSLKSYTDSVCAPGCRIRFTRRSHFLNVCTASTPRHYPPTKSDGFDSIPTWLCRFGHIPP
jgi:hypothetical protein